MPSKMIVAVVILAVLTAAGYWARHTFAQSIVHDPTTAPAVGSTTQQVKGNIKKNLGAAQAKFGDAKSDANKDSRK